MNNPQEEVRAETPSPSPSVRENSLKGKTKKEEKRKIGRGKTLLTYSGEYLSQRERIQEVKEKEAEQKEG